MNFVKRVLIFLLAAVMLFGTISLTSCSQDLTDLAPEELRERVAMESKHFRITGTMYAYYFYDMGMQFIATMTDEDLINMGYVEGMSLKELYFSNGESIYDRMRDGVAAQMENILVWCEGAYQAGITLESSDYSQIENYLVGIRSEAAVNGYASVDDYLAMQYGGYVSEADMANILQLEALAAKYANYLDNTLPDMVTQEHIDQALAETAGERDETPTRKIAHIFFANSRYDENADVTAEEAQKVYDTFMASDKSEESFKALKEQYSADANLYYENIRKGDMIAEIDTWLFAEGRHVGDVGMMSSQTGYHIVYYTADGDPLYLANAKLKAQEVLRDETIQALRKKTGIKTRKNVLNAINI